MGKKIFGIDIRDLVKTAAGKEGMIYLTPDKKVLKVYVFPERCKSEYKILKRMEGNKYFPKVFECKGRFMLREYVEGTPFREYIRENGLSKKLAMTLIEFAEDFNQNDIISFDGLNRHVFILNDKEIKVVDPVRRNSSLYKMIFKNLSRLEVYDDFIDILKDKRPDLAKKWLGKS